ncbi:hypothetical protein [Polaromonas sp. JS666]|uniref:hypothetical protein n=1 Tax=Polaromonas sp. (strain JS666 / ATCC BAA-500) TaxID=296591 RepID=UPI0012EE8A2D|nr:hypothetical protein [Polaromonas sp. JS666]
MKSGRVNPPAESRHQPLEIDFRQQQNLLVGVVYRLINPFGLFCVNLHGDVSLAFRDTFITAESDHACTGQAK